MEHYIIHNVMLLNTQALDLYN